MRTVTPSHKGMICADSPQGPARPKTARIERYNSNMKQDIVLQTLKQKNIELTNKFGVKSLLLFGSVARNESTPTSDVDLLVEFNRPVGYFGLFALHDYLEKLLGCLVDLGTPDSLKPYIKDRVIGDRKSVV